MRVKCLAQEHNTMSSARARECSVRKTVSFEKEIMHVQGRISEHIFAPNAGYCVYCPSNIFRNMRSFENFSWRIFSHVMCLNQ